MCSLHVGTLGLAVMHSDIINKSWIPTAACTYFWLTTLSVLTVRLSWLKTDSKAQSQLQESSSTMLQLDSDKSHLVTEHVLCWSKMNQIRQIKDRGFPLFSIDTKREVWCLSLSTLVISVMGPPGISQSSFSVAEDWSTLERSWHSQGDGNPSPPHWLSSRAWRYCLG